MRRRIKETILDKLVKEAMDGNFNNYIRERNKKEISSIKKSISSRYNQERVISLVLALKESEEGINYRIKNVVEVMYKLLFKYEAYMKERVESALKSCTFFPYSGRTHAYIEDKRKFYKELRKIACLKSLKLSKKVRNNILIKFKWTKESEDEQRKELAYFLKLKVKNKLIKLAEKSMLLALACIASSAASFLISRRLKDFKAKQLEQKVG